MATDADEMDEGSEGESRGKRGSGGLILIIVTLLALAGGGFGAWKFFGAKDEPKKPEAAQPLPPRYINLDPPFVVNFEAEAMVRFLQITIGIMTRDEKVEHLIKDNDPRIRNDLLLILGGQNYETVSKLEGKEELRKRCLESVRAVVLDSGGEAAKVEALYFTSFVMQ